MITHVNIFWQQKNNKILTLRVFFESRIYYPQRGW